MLVMACKSNLYERSSLYLINVVKDTLELIRVLSDDYKAEIIVGKKLKESLKYGFGCSKGMSFC